MSGFEIHPPPRPNRKKYPFVGTIRFGGMIIHVENLPGSIREGTDANGKKWRTEMKWPYGEIHKTEGLDGDKVDVYVGPDAEAKKVYVVNQNHPKGHPKAGQFDEQKVMLGFSSAEDAKKAYLAHYDNDSFFRSITEMDLNMFKKSVFGEDKGEKIAAYREGFAAALRKFGAVTPEELAAYQHYPLYGALAGTGIGTAAGLGLGALLHRPGLGSLIGAPIGAIIGGALPYASERVRASRRAVGQGIEDTIRYMEAQGDRPFVVENDVDAMNRAYNSAFRKALRNEAAKLS